MKTLYPKLNATPEFVSKRFVSAIGKVFRVSALSVTVFLGAGASAQSNLQTSVSMEAPKAEDVVFSYTGTEGANRGGGTWRGEAASTTAGKRDLGEVFRLATENDIFLNKVTVQLSAGGSAVNNKVVSLTLYRFDTIQLNIVPAETIGVFNGVLPASGMVKDSYLTFEIPETKLIANANYGFLLSFVGEDNNGSMPLVHWGLPSSGGVVPWELGRSLSYTEGDGLQAVQWQAMQFYLQGTAAIPEASFSSFLMGAAVLGVLSVALRRRNARMGRASQA